jgi:glycosyltransferase involved in cell wall biosynthesis
MAQPSLSIVIPTRNRPESAARCVSIVLDSEPRDFELLLVDQSDGPETAQAVAFAGSDARFHYLHSVTRGAASARNAGIERARGDIIAFTDDDCCVAPGWVRGIRRVFEWDSEVAAMFGRVALPAGPPGTWAASFAASSREQPRRGYPRFPAEWGISANMACRREVFDKIGVFDPLFGPGAPLMAAEDFDLIIRMRKAGLKIIHAQEVSVDHVGLRRERAVSAILCGYHFSVGAALLKHVRMGDLALLGIFARFAAEIFGRACKHLVESRRPRGLKHLLYLLRGALTSFRYRIDLDRQLYIACPVRKVPRDAPSALHR